MSYTLKRIKAENRAMGGFYFEAATMRFFRSRIAPGVHEGPGGIYFVTSEKQSDDHSRRYSVARFTPGSRSIDRASAFQQFATLAEARAFAQEQANATLREET